MKKLFILWCLFQMACCREKGSHSLWMKATYIKGRTPFPEFSAYGMLDDIVFGYYDSNEHKMVYKHIHQASNSSLDEDDMDYAQYLIEYNQKRIIARASYLSNYYNHTNDAFTFQRAAGCELQDNDKTRRIMHKDAYNGQAVQDAYYDVVQEAIHFTQQWTNSDSPLWTLRSGIISQYKYIFSPKCIEFLKKHLAKERNRVLKKVKPRVRLLQREKRGSAGVLLTCLATGFYPRHINLTLLRDGQSVSDHQVTGGELLPNGDETYQMRKSLEVSAEELQHHHYTCTAEHLSLDNKLDMDLERDWDSVTTAINIPALVAKVVSVCCLVGAIIVFIVYKKMCAGRSSKRTPTEGNSTAAPKNGSQTSVPSNHSAASSEDSQNALLRDSISASNTDDPEKIEDTTSLESKPLKELS